MTESTIYLIVLLLPIAAFVVWPLFASEQEPAPVAPKDPRAVTEARKLAAYAAIKEVELDKRIGKLSDEDYADLIARYKEQAVEAISALETMSASSTKRPAYCAACGTKQVSGGKFCPGCGRVSTM